MAASPKNGRSVSLEEELHELESEVETLVAMLHTGDGMDTEEVGVPMCLPTDSPIWSESFACARLNF